MSIAFQPTVVPSFLSIERGLVTTKYDRKYRKCALSAVSKVSIEEKLPSKSGSCDVLDSKSSHRRDFLKLLVLGSAVCSITSIKNAAAEGSTKVWGAAELDAAMYMCGATGKIFGTPLFCPPKTKVETAPARSLDPELSKTLSDIPGKLLLERFRVDASAYSTARTGYIQSLEREFQKRAKFVSGDTADQFGFDFLAYVEWKVAAQLLPRPDDRSRFVAAVGAESLTALRASGVRAVKYDARVEVRPSLVLCTVVLCLASIAGRYAR